jgi:hypothetical protein
MAEYFPTTLIVLKYDSSIHVSKCRYILMILAACLNMYNYSAQGMSND